VKINLLAEITNFNFTRMYGIASKNFHEIIKNKFVFINALIVGLFAYIIYKSGEGNIKPEFLIHFTVITGFLISITASSGIINRELKDRRIELVVVKPVTWLEIITGKILAALLVSAGITFIFAGGMYLCLIKKFGILDYLRCNFGIVLLLPEMASWISFCFLLSIFFPSSTNSIFTFILATFTNWWFIFFNEAYRIFQPYLFLLRNFPLYKELINFTELFKKLLENVVMILYHCLPPYKVVEAQIKLISTSKVISETGIKRIPWQSFILKEISLLIYFIICIIISWGILRNKEMR